MALRHTDSVNGNDAADVYDKTNKLIFYIFAIIPYHQHKTLV